MSHRVTYICDSCEKQFIIDDIMDIPSYWIALQVAIANKDGLVHPKERDVYSHFCCQECAVEYLLSDEMKEKILTVDQLYDEFDETEDDDEEDDENTEGDLKI